MRPGFFADVFKRALGTKEEPVPITAPSMETPQVAVAAEEERKRLRQQRGRASTILTGGTGLLDVPTLASVLLGR